MTLKAAVSPADLQMLRSALGQYHTCPLYSRARHEIINTAVAALQGFPDWTPRRVRLWLNNNRSHYTPYQTPNPATPVAPDEILNQVQNLQQFVAGLFIQLGSTPIPPEVSAANQNFIDSLVRLFTKRRLPPELVDHPRFRMLVAGINPTVRIPTGGELRAAIAGDFSMPTTGLDEPD
jgi:hypothetical protein